MWHTKFHFDRMISDEFESSWSLTPKKSIRESIGNNNNIKKQTCR